MAGAAGHLVHRPGIGGGAVMAGRARCLHRAVVHAFDGERRGTRMAVRTFVAEQAGQRGRYVGAERLGDDAAVTRVMAALAGDRARMVVGIGAKPIGLAMAGVATGGGRQVIGRLVIHFRIAADVAGGAGTGRNAGVAVGSQQGQPGDAGAVAVLAGLCRRDMRHRLAGCLDAIVTGGATAGDHALMAETGRFPLHRGVAGIARLRGRDMGCRLGLGIESGIGAAMTAGALTGGTGMTHRGRREGNEIGVTGIALAAGRHMGGRLAQCIGAVMAAGTAAGYGGRHRGVIEHGGRPGDGRVMAGRTLCRGRHVGHRLHLRVLRQIGAAVAGRALRQGAVIHHGRGPIDEAVAVTGIALAGDRNVRCRLGQRIGKDVGAVVAAGTLAGRPAVAHLGRLEGQVVLVATVALPAGRNVGGRFAKRRRAVVTGRTGPRGTGGVLIGGQRPGGGRAMAGIALCRGTDVRCRLGLGIDRQVAAAMAGSALAGGAAVVHLGRGEGNIVLVAAIAGLGSRNMRRILAQCVGTVMAAGTSPGHHAAVAVGGRFPDRRPVAGIARLAGRNVGWRLGLGIERGVGAAMAAGALTGGTGVIHRRRRKSRENGVTGVALAAGRHVIGRLAQRIGAVMAGRAAPGHRRRRRGVVEAAGGPGGGRVVTGRTLRRRRNVGERLALGVLRQVSTAVAGRTLGQAAVIHRRRRPTAETVGMAGIALAGHRNMADRLAQCVGKDIGAAVAGRTLAGRAAMVHPRRSEGRVIGVAGIALRGTGDVIGRLAEGGAAVMASRTGTDGGGGVDIGRRRPAGGRSVAGVALGAGRHMACRLGLGVDRNVSAAMAVRALAAGRAVVHLGRRESNVVLVAAIARRRSGNMSRRLAQCVATVVAGGTASGHHAAMAEGGRFPGDGTVAAVAGLGGGNMGRRLGLGVKRGIGPAMAAGTLAGGPGVIHRSRGKGSEYRMAGVALAAGRHMVGRLAQGIAAVVAGRATPCHSRRCGGMVEGASGPGGRRVVAGRTLRARRDMGQRLALGVLRQVGAAVAGRALAQAAVVHHRRRPVEEAVGMAGIAFRTDRDMAGRLGLGVLGQVAAVMATRTLAVEAAVVHPGRLEGGEVIVTGIALAAGRDVRCRLAQRRRSVMAA